MKETKPQNIKHLVIALDVSTSNTGYAILADGVPMVDANDNLSIGSIHMTKTEKNKLGNDKDVLYENYGDKMFHGSWGAFSALSKLLYNFLKPLTDAHYASKREQAPSVIFDIEKVSVVLEVSEIPNFNKNMGQTLTTTRKLALYTGATLAIVRNIIGLVFEPWKDKVECKFVKPNEWQNRLWTKEEVFAAETKELKGTKVLSLQKANDYLKEFNIKLDSHDASDAVNIARLAEHLRDNLFVSKFQGETKKQKTKSLNEIAKLKARLNDYMGKAYLAKNTHDNKVKWQQNANYDLLSKTDKNLWTKIANSPVKTELKEFLTPQQQREVDKINRQLNAYYEQVKAINNPTTLKEQNEN